MAPSESDLIAVSEGDEIQRSQEKLTQSIEETFIRTPRNYWLGFRGGAAKFEYLHINDMIWYGYKSAADINSNRHWNSFGVLSALHENKTNLITVEFNIKKDEINLRGGGLFVKNATNGKTYLAHTGRIGGGRPGIDKKHFLDWYGREKLDEFFVSQKRSTRHDCILVGELSSQEFLRNLTNFVCSVARFKIEFLPYQSPTAALYDKTIPPRRQPRHQLITTVAYSRDYSLVRLAKQRANGLCQLCGNTAPFTDKGEVPYLECHHIDWLSVGGRDAIDNVVALCPNCHRKVHILNNQEDVKKLRDAASENSWENKK